MKSKASNKRPTPSKRVLCWDEAVFDPADLVRDVKDLADHYAGQEKIDLTHIYRRDPGSKVHPCGDRRTSGGP